MCNIRNFPKYMQKMREHRKHSTPVTRIPKSDTLAIICECILNISTKRTIIYFRLLQGGAYKLSFTAHDQSVYELFNRNCYKVPRNQRRYVWSKRNWQELLDDIMLVNSGAEKRIS